MPPSTCLLDPFTAHRQAFHLEWEGQDEKAASWFAFALRGFSRLLRDPGFLTSAQDRASRLAPENPEALAVEFMERMPGWLLGVHYDRSLRFFAAGDMEAARLHWNILQKAVPLAELAGGRFLEDCRARFAMHFLGEKPIKDTTDEQQRFLETAERLLALDPENQMARRGAIQGYVYYLGQGMEDIGVRTRKKGKKPSPLDLPMRKGSLLKTKRRLRTASNKLKRHLRRAMSDGGSLPAAETARHAISLANYYAYTERVPEAWRLARRAKVLAPDDGDVTNFFAWIKKLKRRMRR